MTLSGNSENALTEARQIDGESTATQTLELGEKLADRENWIRHTMSIFCLGKTQMEKKA